MKVFKLLINYIKTKIIILVIFFLLLSILFINSVHTSYPDEFDNITGGYFITQGKFPYTDFFTHHGPFGYIFASIIAFFSGPSFVRFRLILGLIYFILFVLFFLFIKNKFSKELSKVILIIIFFMAIGATFFWGHMLLADTLVGLFIFVAYSFLFLKVYFKKNISTTELVLLSFLLAFALFTSITFLYVIFIFYLFLFYYLLKTIALSIKKSIFIFSFPYLLFLIYFFITKSLNDFYFQAIIFNKDYYITFADGSAINNPLRFAVFIFHEFFESYKTVLTASKDFNLGFPLNSTFALSNLFLIIYLLLKKRLNLAILTSGLLVYLNSRSNPYLFKETDYQSTPYIYYSFFNGIFLIYFLWNELKTKLEPNKKIVYSFLFLILSTYHFFSGLFLLSKFFEKAYGKYMGKESLIYDRPAIASVLNSLLSTQDYYYIGPFSFEDHLYMRAKLPSRYFINIPAMDKSEKIKREFMEDIKKNKPTIVVYDTDFQIFSVFPAKYFVEYLRENYFTLSELKKELPNLILKTKSFDNYTYHYDFERHFFFDKEKKDILIEKLKDINLITFK